MKKIIYLLLFIPAFAFGQKTEITRDNIYAVEEIYRQDTPIIELIQKYSAIPTSDSTWLIIKTDEIQDIISGDTKLQFTANSLTAVLDGNSRLILTDNYTALTDGVNQIRSTNSGFSAGAFGDVLNFINYDTIIFSGSLRIADGSTYTPTIDRDLITKGYADDNYLQSDSATYADTALYVAGAINVGDTVNYSKGAVLLERQFVFSDTILTDEPKSHYSICLVTDSANISIQLPPLDSFNTTSDVKTLQFLLPRAGSYTLIPKSGETINGQTTLTNNVPNSSVTILPTPTQWRISQDSRGNTTGQIRFIPINEPSGISTYLRTTIEPDSVNTTEQIIYNSVTNGSNVPLFQFVTDTNIFEPGAVTGGNALFRLRSRISSGAADAATYFVAIYKRDALGNELLINDSTNRVSIPQSASLNYIDYNTAIFDYTYETSDRFVFKVYANEITGGPVIVVGIEGLVYTYYTRGIDPSIIRVNVGAAGQNFNSQYYLNGNLAGDQNVNHYNDSLVVDKDLRVNGDIYQNGELFTATDSNQVVSIVNNTNFDTLRVKVVLAPIGDTLELPLTYAKKIIVDSLFMLNGSPIVVLDSADIVRIVDSLGYITSTATENQIMVADADGNAVGNGLITNLNVAIGNDVLTNITSGYYNAAIGFSALTDNTDGAQNTAIGALALNKNTTGNGNIAIGNALRNNISGSANVAVGELSLNNNNGSNNIAIGTQAGRWSTGSNKLYINSQYIVSGTYHDDTTRSVIYASMDTNTLNQRLRLNSNVYIKHNLYDKNGNEILGGSGGGITTAQQIRDSIATLDSINLNGSLRGSVTTESFATSKSINYFLDHYKEYTATGNTTLTVSGVPYGFHPTLALIIDATGGYTISIAGATAWSSTNAIDNTANAINLIQFKVIDGTTYYFVTIHNP